MINLDILDHVAKQLSNLREKKPLVLNLTNYVAMNLNANVLLAIGASPIMAYSRQELAEIVQLSQAVVINIGTLDSNRIKQMEYAIVQANQAKKTVILDPVGCGASKLRTDVSRRFASMIDDLVIRANASEIMALAGDKSQGKGVDSLDDAQSAITCAKRLVCDYDAKEVIISGEVDYCVYQDGIFSLHNGDAIMPSITAMGCSHTALTGAFSSVDSQYAGLCATAVLGVVGQLAAAKSQGPASFQIQLIDALYQLTDASLSDHLKAFTLDA